MMMTEPLVFFLLLVLLVTALVIFIFDDLLYVIIVFGAFSMAMSLVWQQLNAPDIAITEAAVGIAVSVIMITVLAKVGRRPQ